jgi:hypothetical protein
MFKNGLDADVEALRENKERELFLELGGEDMVDGERVGLSVPQPRTMTLATTVRCPATKDGSVPARELSR